MTPLEYCMAIVPICMISIMLAQRNHRTQFNDSCHQGGFTHDGTALEDPIPVQLSTDGLKTRILEQLNEEAVIGLDSLIQMLPEYSWNQVFSAVDQLPGQEELCCADIGMTIRCFLLHTRPKLLSLTRFWSGSAYTRTSFSLRLFHTSTNLFQC